jgi:hypothetical protein
VLGPIARPVAEVDDVEHFVDPARELATRHRVERPEERQVSRAVRSG